ncbi:MAG: hypothetical protein GX416_13480 [Bacteroidales bacterium]|nr:hypothetical protein [Bacteroidales bacterium]
MDKIKIHLEFLLKETAKHVLWNTISTPAGMENWFANRISVKDKVFTFWWSDDEVRSAEIVAIRTFSFIRFHWLDDDNPRTYFEIKMCQDELTKAFVLEINDFTNEEEGEDLKELWTSQIAKMRRVLGF